MLPPNMIFVNRMSLAERARIAGFKGSATQTKRARPRKAVKERILARQRGCCLYCEMEIGSTITRNGKPVTLQINWDHFVPYAYAARNSNDNWVAACHVCNGLKAHRMFDTVQEAKDYVTGRAIAKGYEYPALA